MAQLMVNELARIPQVRITQNAEANGVFAELPKKYIPLLQKHYFFYVWNEETSEVRFMTSFDTTESDIQDFISLLKKTIK
jgi:threonine aldolase